MWRLLSHSKWRDMELTISPNPSQGCTYSFWSNALLTLEGCWLVSWRDSGCTTPQSFDIRSLRSLGNSRRTWWYLKLCTCHRLVLRDTGRCRCQRLCLGFQRLFDRYSPKSVWRPHDSSDGKRKGTVPKFEHALLGALSILNISHWLPKIPVASSGVCEAYSRVAWEKDLCTTAFVVPGIPAVSMQAIYDEDSNQQKSGDVTECTLWTDESWYRIHIGSKQYWQCPILINMKIFQIGTLAVPLSLVLGDVRCVLFPCTLWVVTCMNRA